MQKRRFMILIIFIFQSNEISGIDKKTGSCALSIKIVIEVDGRITNTAADRMFAKLKDRVAFDFGNHDDPSVFADHISFIKFIESNEKLSRYHNAFFSYFNFHRLLR